MTDPDAILGFWLDEIGPKGWYMPPEGLDETITQKFEPAWERLVKGGLGLWLSYPTGTLAYIILADQFPRNMFRGQAKAFSTDHIALSAAKMAIKRDWDTRIDEPARQFFYMPLMHSENLCDQDRGVRLIHTRMPETGEGTLLHAKAHREVIRRYGRFPHRNDDLGRTTTEPEAAFLKDGGYGGVVETLKAA